MTFTYNKTWEQIEHLLNRAEEEKRIHRLAIQNPKIPMKKKAEHMRNYKGLQGVCYSLRYVLGDRNINIEMVLGRDNK